MVLEDITNNDFKFDQPINFKRRRLDKRRHSLIPIPSNNTMLSFQYRQIEVPQLAKLKSRRYSYAPLRNNLEESSIKPNQNQQVNILSLNKLRGDYNDSKAKYLSLEKSIDNLKSAHELEMRSIKDEYLLKKSEMKNQFTIKLKEIEDEYFDKVKKIVEDNSLKSNNEINSLKDDIDGIKSKINHVSGSLFKERQEELNLAHKEKIKFLKRDFDVHVKNLENDKIKLQQQIDKLNKSIDLHTNKTRDILDPKEKKLRGLIENALNDENQLHSDELNHLTEIEMIESDLRLERDNINKLKDDVKSFLLEQTDFEKMLLEEQTNRRILHNKLQELKGNIRVFCRLKPSPKAETFHIEKEGFLQTMNGKESLIIKELNKKNVLTSPNKSKLTSYKFQFDTIFDQNSTNEDVFGEISQLVQSALDGYNVCIFTYGQTGSGKTYTMSKPKDGLIPRSLNQIFERIQNLTSLGWKFELHGQFFEIYGDSINDLISKNKSNGVDINHIEKIKLYGVEQIHYILSRANLKRSTASTNSNNESSRSHSIFRFSINGTNKDGIEFQSILNLIDLAGSERISSSQVKGVRLKETQAINKSLSAIGDVINALSLKSNHIPYRNSKLTYLLKDSLGGDSKTLMFVNVSCLKEHFNESLNSLRFANKVNNTKIN